MTSWFVSNGVNVTSVWRNILGLRKFLSFWKSSRGLARKCLLLCDVIMVICSATICVVVAIVTFTSPLLQSFTTACKNRAFESNLYDWSKTPFIPSQFKLLSQNVVCFVTKVWTTIWIGGHRERRKSGVMTAKHFNPTTCETKVILKVTANLRRKSCLSEHNFSCSRSVSNCCRRLYCHNQVHCWRTISS